MTNRIKAILTALLVIAAVSAMCATAAAEIPETFDWRDVNGTNYVTPVKEQLCGDCAMHSVIAVLESVILIEHPEITEIDMSEQYYISDCWKLGDCSGVTPSEFWCAFKHCRDVGVLPESCVPYLGYNSLCTRCANWETMVWRVGACRQVSGEQPMKAAIMQDGPMGADIYTDQYYPPVTAPHTPHVITIIGWNDSVGPGCWIIKNSLGDDWGYNGNGYGWVPYASIPNAFGMNGSYTCERTEGDVNNDGLIDGADSLWIARHIVGITTLTGGDFDAADVNDDNIIDGADSLYIAHRIVNPNVVFSGGACAKIG